MKDIIKGVQRLATDELKNANKKFPLFASDHEALGVLMEEVAEVKGEVKNMTTFMEIFRDCVFEDDERNKPTTIRQLRASAVLCAAESIQVIAMCDKQIMSKESKDE